MATAARSPAAGGGVGAGSAESVRVMLRVRPPLGAELEPSRELVVSANEEKSQVTLQASLSRAAAPTAPPRTLTVWVAPRPNAPPH